MSDLVINPAPPIAVTIASTDPVLAANVEEFGATLNFLTAQISAAVQSVADKVNQSDLNSLLELLTATQQSLTDLEAAVEAKAAIEHTQAISSITGLQTALENLQSQISAGGGSTGVQAALAPLQAQIDQATAALLAVASRQSVETLDQELTALEISVNGLSTALAGKANAQHSQPISSITGLDSTLNSLQAQIATLQAAQQSGSGSAPAAAPLTFTVSQSSVWNGDTGLYLGTNTNLIDNNFDTCAATNPADYSWIRFDLGSLKTIERFGLVSGGNPNVGSLAYHYNNDIGLEISNDGTNWIRLLRLTGVNNNAFTWFAVLVRARYVQIAFRGSNGRVSTGDVRILGY